MKLSKTSWLLLAIGAFIIPLASLGAVHFQQVHQQNQLNEELAQAQLKLKAVQLEQLAQRQGELEKHLSQTRSQFQAARTILSQPVGSIGASSTLFDIAEACSAEVIEISSPGLTSAELEGIPCSVLTLTVRVEGDVPALVSFITKLNGYLRTGVVQSAAISIPEMTSGEESSANIRLVVYTYQGD